MESALRRLPGAEAILQLLESEEPTPGELRKARGGCFYVSKSVVGLFLGFSCLFVHYLLIFLLHIFLFSCLCVYGLYLFILLLFICVSLYYLLFSFLFFLFSCSCVYFLFVSLSVYIQQMNCRVFVRRRNTISSRADSFPSTLGYSREKLEGGSLIRFFQVKWAAREQSAESQKWQKPLRRVHHPWAWKRCGGGGGGVVRI